MRFRPLRQPQWEITDLKEVAPTPIYYDSEAEGMFLFPLQVDHFELTRVFLFFTLTDLEICRVAPREVTGTYTFDFPSSKGYRYSDALTHSRAKLMEEMSKLGYNFLIMEGSVPSFFSLPSSKTLNGSCFKLKFRWSITTMRKSKAERIEVRYHAQPAVARGWQRPRTPPYLQLLESH